MLSSELIYIVLNFGSLLLGFFLFLKMPNHLFLGYCWEPLLYEMI